jgi:uncharacterized protein YecT (DUF1311 family)
MPARALLTSAVVVLASFAFAQKDTAPEQAPVASYDKAIFHDPVPVDQLTFLNRFAGKPTKEVLKDKQFRQLMKNVIPGVMFHYGWDFMLSDSLYKVLNGSQDPVQIRDGRYVSVSGSMGPYLRGRGFMWIDMQDGIGLGGFYFHPTNGEPTPSVTVFSNQIREETLRMTQLPPAFADEFYSWSADSKVPVVTTRYFIGGGAPRKILLEHDEDYCAPTDGSKPDEHCEQMNADAADIDLTAAYYLEQVNYATNATAWMIVGADQTAWIEMRNNACGGPNWLPCRIRMTRERTHVVLRRHTISQLPHK